MKIKIKFDKYDVFVVITSFALTMSTYYILKSDKENKEETVSVLSKNK